MTSRQLAAVLFLVGLGPAACSPFSVRARGGAQGGSMTVGPGGDAGSPLLDRTRPPALGAPPPVRLPEPRPFTLRNGLPVVLIPWGEVPIVGIELQLPGGATLQRPGEAGLAALTADMIDEGTTTRSAPEIAEALEVLGASFSSTAGWDLSTVRLNVLSANLPAALDIVADVVLRPSFPEGELERVRSERVTRVLQGLDEPRILADDALASVLFGGGHPYGSPLLGTRSSLEALGSDRVRAFHAAAYHAGNARLLVVGDVSEERLRPLLEEHFGSWRSGPAPGSPTAATEPGPSGRIFLVDKPGAPQSEIRVGRVTTHRLTEDYFPLMVLNTVLGGSFTSRLNTRLREEKGYTYGARSTFALRVRPGPFVAAAAVHTPVTADAVRDFLTEIRRLSEEPVPAEELARARNYLALRLPQGFETVRDVAERFSDVLLYGLPPDYFDRYVDRTLAVTADDVSRVARRHLPADGLVIVVAGDRAVVEEPLRALGIGEVVVLPTPPVG